MACNSLLAACYCLFKIKSESRKHPEPRAAREKRWINKVWWLVCSINYLTPKKINIVSLIIECWLILNCISFGRIVWSSAMTLNSRALIVTAFNPSIICLEFFRVHATFGTFRFRSFLPRLVFLKKYVFVFAKKFLRANHFLWGKGEFR